MSQKLRDILSELATDLKAENYDDRISFRYLNSKFKSKMDYLLRLESKSREFLRDYTLWKKLKCQELEDLNPSVCGFIDTCKTLKKTVNSIPEAISTLYGKMIRVFSLDESKEYTFINSSDYKDYINRPFLKNKTVFWIDGDKIIIPNDEIDNIIVYIIPKDDNEIDKLNGESDACSGPLEGSVSYPDYLVTLAKQETLKELLGAYKRIPEDERGDENSNNKV